MGAIALKQPHLKMPDAFTSVWDTRNISDGSSNSLQVMLPLYEGGKYNFKVDWGDGTVNRISSFDDVNVMHTYAAEGEYTITIRGVLSGFRFNNTSDRLKLKSVLRWGCLRLGNLGFSFYGCQNLTLGEVSDTLNLKGVTTLRYLFSQCFSLTHVNRITEWDTSAITDISAAFWQASVFNQSLNGWDTSKVTDMSFVFQEAPLFNSALDQWNVGSCTTLYQIFKGCTVFNQNIENWDVSNVENMRGIFNEATAFNQPLNNWDTGKVTTMMSMFTNTYSFNQNINNWDVSNVTNMQSMFYRCPEFNQPLNNWDTSSVTNISQMFCRAYKFNQPLDNWDVSKVTSFTYLFRGTNASLTTTFNQDISMWDTSNVTDFSSMFLNNPVFNHSLSSWNTGKVTDFSYMFHASAAFNQDISMWDFTKATTLDGFMSSKTFANYSKENYDALLNSLNQQNITVKLKPAFGTIRYTANGQTARNNLTQVKGWTITDGGITT